MPKQAMISAFDIARQIEAGERTARSAIDQSLEQIAARERHIQAFAHLKPASDVEVGAGPLSGISLGVKDIFDSFDMPTCYGSPIYDGFQPRGDAALVHMCRRAGASIMGKTTTTEFAFFQPTETRNPHNDAHTPGGSSAGSAAAIAAGMIAAAIGTQTGGSMVRPAAFCGVAGFKPSFRLLPTAGLKHFAWSLDTPGTFAASVKDVAFVTQAITNRDLMVKDEPGAPTIGLYRGHNFEETGPDMQDTIERVVALAERSGARVVEVLPVDKLTAAHAIHPTLEGYESGLALGHEFQEHRNLMSTKLVERLESGTAISPEEYDGARRTARIARKSALDAFDGVDCLLAPSAPGAAPLGLETTGNSTFNRLWTLLGVPCVNVPGLFDANGLPVGVQIITRFGRDREALQAAHWLEQVIATDDGD
ncbi:MAG: amidase [Pseudomonadota bacterium]